MKKAFHVITKILEIFILAILFLFFLIFAVPRFFGITPDIVLSGSMEPSIPTGSICFVDRRADKYEVEVNDIISYKLSNDALILHRVIAFDAKGNYITKGDANDNQDLAPVSPEQFVGKAMFAVPYIGYAVEALQHREALIAIATIIAMLIFLEIVSIGPKAKEGVKNEDA